MKGRGIILLLIAFLLLAFTNDVLAQKLKVIVDQDARGPATTDMQSILIFLQSDKFDVVGITTVSGDQWVKEETQRTLRLLEIAGRTDVPVAEGAEFPLLNSKEESERWEALYGKFRYKGCWSDFSTGLSRAGCNPTASGGRASHQAARRNRCPLHRPHGAPVSWRSCDMGRWSADQYRSRSAA